MAVSSSTPRVSVKDRLGPANSAHASTASKHASEGSRSKVIGNFRIRLVFTAEKATSKPDHGRKRVEDTLPRTRHRDGQTDKTSKLAKMAEEADKALEVLLKQRQDIAEQMLRMAELKDEASSYAQSEEHSGHTNRRQRKGKEPAHSGYESRGQPRDRRRSRSPTLRGSKRVLHPIGSRE